MIRELMFLVDSRLVLVLEGGYDLSLICDVIEFCIKVFFGDEVKM